MTDTPKPNDPVVDQLERLARDQDRATLAQLRGSLQEGRALDGLRVVLPFIKRGGPGATRAEDDALLLAGLFALHPESGSLSLASALRIVARDSDSVELRFRALLGACLFYTPDAAPEKRGVGPRCGSIHDNKKHKGRETASAN